MHQTCRKFPSPVSPRSKCTVQPAGTVTSWRDELLAPDSSSGQHLFRFLCWIRQLQSPDKLVHEARLIGGGLLTLHVQQQIARHVFGDRVFGTAPLTPGYQRRVLQALVRAAEEDGCDLDDAFVERFTRAQLAGQATSGDMSWCHKTFTYKENAATHGTQHNQRPLLGTISLCCSRNLLEGGTGCHEWSAGLRMAEFCLSNPSLFAGKACIELGCGTGTVGVALVRAGASPVLLTDGNASAIENCRHNLALNGVPVESAACTVGALRQGVQVVQRAWEDDWAGISRPDFVLGADIMYDPPTFPRLVALVKQLLDWPTTPGCSTPVAFLAGQVRNESSLQLFEAEVVKQALQFEVMQWRPTVSFRHLLRTEELSRVKMYRIQIAAQVSGNRPE